MAMHRSNVVAIVNSNPDAVEMLVSVCRAAGFAVVAASAHDLRTGLVDAATFLDTHNPSVVVFDVAPPYGLNWRVLEHLRSLSRGHDRQFVITSVNKRQTEALARGEDRIYEVVGKPYDLDEIAQAVKEAFLTRPLDRPERITAESAAEESPERRHEDRRSQAQMVTGRRREDRRSA